MQSSDQEIARRALVAALERLDGEKRSDSSQTDAPSNVFIIMLGNHQSEPASGETLSAQSNISHKTVEAHPSLQRFDLPPLSSCSTAPTMCFLEPDRVCVNSGACQRLGH